MVLHNRPLCACLPLESSHIPELLLDTAGSHSEKAPDGPSTAHPQDLPEDPGDSEAREGEFLPVITHILLTSNYGSYCTTFSCCV